MLALGAYHEADEDRWYHPRHREQFLSETPEEYLGWLKGYALGRDHADQWLPLDDDARDGRKILALENFERVDENDKPHPRDIEVVWWSKTQAGWVSFGIILASFEPTHYREIGALPMLKGDA
ncbi:hypothetical protein [Aureimonas sp. SK2]|uniref:hypothetical protein n=1 Tax=Aureimonas sp. SK2 TaxID=3015992 RepID=UPI002443DB1C|nr:hypothetical protein [Aureimonas sp. SK2]